MRDLRATWMQAYTVRKKRGCGGWQYRGQYAKYLKCPAQPPQASPHDFPRLSGPHATQLHATPHALRHSIATHDTPLCHS